MDKAARRVGIGVVPAVLLKIVGGSGAFSEEEEAVLLLPLRGRRY